ncbi:vomeronasal type-2 receptor 26-like [Pantherophis guttatus]|uniref:Vomeronasal type-2 receptor 26-like n=1 Tax=Pantherophis guttatus TaxID=94885 RepID=A0ABM3ZC61_PANGU|nr:vomeronasal type-2 receptor 26-like [Pantherophis guttatus]XP_060545961.1 vomeronasal type-2 receptor 26-like [Pantherophis guttatus]
MITKFYQHLLALVFAVNEINKDTHILPNATLGCHIYDSYYDARSVYRNILDLLSKADRFVPNFQCGMEKNVIAVIGGIGHDVSMGMADLLSLYKIPQITYGSFVPEKTYKTPSFYRIVPNEAHQVLGMIQVLQHFGWTWVGLFIVDDNSGTLFLQSLQVLFSKNGICSAFIERPPKQAFIYKYEDTLETAEKYNLHMMQGKANVFIVYGETSSFIWLTLMIETVSSLPEELIPGGKVWIMTAQIDFALMSFQQGWRLQKFGGAISLTVQSNEVQGFHTFLQRLQPFETQGDIFLKDFWEQTFGCLFTNSTGTLNVNKTCTGEEKLERLPGSFFEMAMAAHSYSIYNAIYAVAHALHKISSTQLKRKTKMDHQDFSLQKLKPWQIRPVSVCNPSCLPGFWKEKKEGEKFCCFNCVPCPEGKISNQKDMNDCFKCPEDQYPSRQHDHCVLKTIIFLSYQDPLGACLAFLALFFSLLILFLLGIFIKHRDTPIVKANNRELTYTLLGFLLLCFLCSFLFIGQPGTITCLFQQAAFGFVFSAVVSCILAKNITVIVAFMATKPGSSLRKWMGKKLGRCIILSCSLFQATICVVWLVISPPFPDLDHNTLITEIIAECNEGSSNMFYLVLGYLGLLSIISFMVAFQTRKLPDNFNEAKFITFSMLIFCAVWFSFIPAYLSIKGKYMIAVEIFSILASTFGLLGCIFFPKFYIIVLRPELNSKEHLIKTKT